MIVKRTLILCVLLLSGFFRQLYAHPHMMLTSRCTVHWEGSAIRGITLEWEFDKFFSADIRFYYDVDQNGLYDAEETAEVFQFAFSNLQKYNYFVFFREGSQRFSPGSVENFAVRNLDDETLEYSFYIPVEDFSGRTLSIAVYDYSFFCHVTYHEEEPVRLDFDPAAVDPVVRIVENKDYPVYYDPFAPMSDMTIHTEWRPGLETFYPQEIQIEF